MRNYTLVVCLAVLAAGCGSAGSGSTANNVTMQGGQWEYVVVPENGAIPMFIDVNLAGTNREFTGTDAQIFQPSEDNIPIQSGPVYCGAFNLAGSIGGSKLNVKMSWPPSPSDFASFSGELAANGQSLSEGTYQGKVCVNGAGPTSGGIEAKAKLTGYTIAPVNGTFTGTLNSSLYGADVVTLTITQNPDFSLSVTGTSVENGVTSTLIASNVPQNGGPQNNGVIGATVYINGSAKNVSGSEPFGLTGHLNSMATQLTITTMFLGSNEYSPNDNITGALTKQ